MECYNKKTLMTLQQKDFTELYCVESSSTTCMIHGNYKSFWIQGVFSFLVGERKPFLFKRKSHSLLKVH